MFACAFLNSIRYCDAEITGGVSFPPPVSAQKTRTSPFAMDDVFDDVEVGAVFKKPANHFGISVFDYYTWAVSSGYLAEVFNPTSEDMDEIANEHLDFLKMPWDETKVEEHLKEVAEVPVENIKQALVGALISNTVTNFYQNRAEELPKIISDVVRQLKLRDPELDADALRRWASEALEYILTADKIEEEDSSEE
jgi:hypothetical protein